MFGYFTKHLIVHHKIQIIDEEAKWTHLSCFLFAQTNLVDVDVFKHIKHLNIQMIKFG